MKWSSLLGNISKSHLEGSFWLPTLPYTPPYPYITILFSPNILSVLFLSLLSTTHLPAQMKLFSPQTLPQGENPDCTGGVFNYCTWIIERMHCFCVFSLGPEGLFSMGVFCVKV